MRLKNFLENTTIIIHNDNFEIQLLTNSFKKFNLDLHNKILDTKELFCLLEPHFHCYELNYLLKNSTSNLKIENSMDLTTNLIKLLNNILEKNNIGDFLNYSLHLKDWHWLEYLTRYNLNEEILKTPKEYEEIFFHNNLSHTTLTLENNCEDCLKDEESWKKLNSKYKFRNSQFEVMQNVRKALEQENFSIIEASTGTGKSIAYSLPAIKEALNGKKIFISTNTKELQNQLVNKDIPFLISNFGLKGKVDYLIIKGKGNYLCVENIKDLLSTHSLLNTMSMEEKLGLVFLDRYTNLALAGDYEEIPYYIIDRFNLSPLISLCKCDSDGCDIKHCRFNCFYKETVEKLKDTNLIVLNHSLLLKWPYDINIENVIIDEAHNLSDSIFDAYATTINSLDIMSLLKEILDYDNKKGYLNYLWKHLKNREVHAREFLRDRISDCIITINNISNFALLKLPKDYDLDITFDENFKNYELIKHNLLILREDLLAFYKPLKKIIDTNNLDSPNIKSRGEILIKKCDKIKDYIDSIECFVKEKEANKCYGFFCTKNNSYWEGYIKHLNSSLIFFERFLNNLSSGCFLSATLKNNGNYENFKNSLAINKITEKFVNEVLNIPESFNLKERSIIATPVSSNKYYSPDFIPFMVKWVIELTKYVDGNILILFTSKKRISLFKKEIEPYINKLHINIYDRKKDILKLKDKTKKSILLGSKGFFEGIDIPGDAVTCVVMDKLPNINPKTPIYKKLIEKEKTFNIGYTKVNCPRAITSFKQCFGRLIRTELDYGYFIVFDCGENNMLKNKILNEFKEVKFINEPMPSIINSLNLNYKRWNLLNLENIIIQSEDKLLKFIIDNKRTLKNRNTLLQELNNFYNKEFENRQLTNKFSLIIENNFIKAQYKDGSILNISNKIILKNAIKNIVK